MKNLYEKPLIGMNKFQIFRCFISKYGHFKFLYLEIFESFQKFKKMTPVRLEPSTSRSFCTTEPTDVT